MLRRIVRVVIAVMGAGGGVLAAYQLSSFVESLVRIHFNFWQSLLYLTLSGIVFGLVAYFIAPWLITLIWSATNWMEGRLQKAPIQDILAGALGLILGLIIANLLGAALGRIPYVGSYLPTLGSLIIGYLGLSVAVKKRDELVSMFGWLRPGGRDRTASRGAAPKILDTSVIIDGRIADICRTSFIEGPLIIPAFVLEELRHIADSSDTLKRNRGRRGLDVLNRIQKELRVPVEVYERDLGETLDVDARLIKLAKLTGGRIVTNDYNLNKVAELQGVSALNINELANAVKPVVLPGEDMLVHIVKDGKESGQGVAYLDDGTMIVVDGGKRHIGETIDVLVTSVLQTAAGRMIFARPRGGAEKGTERSNSL